MIYVLVGAYAALVFAAGVITAMKGKWGTLVVGLFTFAWIFGAVRLALPDSFWDRRFYDEAQRQRARAVAARRRKLAIVGLVIALSVTAALLAAFTAYRIFSPSMEPTLHCARPDAGCRGETSDRVLALRFFSGNDADVGDIVAFSMPARGAERCGSSPGATHISRVEEVEGDTVRVRGDFREQSCDSSVWGPLPKDRLLARVVLRYWPLDRVGRP